VSPAPSQPVLSTTSLPALICRCLMPSGTSTLQYAEMGSGGVPPELDAAVDWLYVEAGTTVGVD
jgi:hypothetical protein